MIAEPYILPETIINNTNSNVYQRLDFLEESYGEIVRFSALNRMDNLNYQARQLLSNLREDRMNLRNNKNFLNSLFLSYEEKLFFLCLREDGGDFVTATYLPECVLMQS